MAGSLFAGKTLDDVMRQVFDAILTKGETIKPSKGTARELGGVLLEITDPRSRLSRTETRGKPFSCLGELCWYLASSDELDFISYYIPDYGRFADGDRIFGAYGPRFFNWKGLNQVQRVIENLRSKSDSRQAVIQLFDAEDISIPHNDVPCTCTLQFMLRSGKLNMFTSMRSNDAFLGLAHDIFSFTMIQEIIANSVGAELGEYTHAVGSLHIYDDKADEASQYLKEGWQSTTLSMPAMPPGDPWSSIRSLLSAEAVLRRNDAFTDGMLGELEPYWSDLVRLLQVFRAIRNRNIDAVLGLRGQISTRVYDQFIQQRIDAWPTGPALG